jgi:mono/diheme cytochrome c family protein
MRRAHPTVRADAGPAGLPSRRARLFAAALLLAAGALFDGCVDKPYRPGDASIGKTIFEDRCSACHDAPDPREYEPGEWPGVLRRMSRDAGLAAQEREDTLAYVLSECRK